MDHVNDAPLFFGLDGATGGYLYTADARDVSGVAQAEELPTDHVKDLHDRARRSEATLGVADTVEDPTDLSQAGWGVVFADDADPAIKDALQELLDHRREQACARKDVYYQEYTNERGYHANESKRSFLQDRGAAPFDPAVPEQMPYYLLLVGAPDAIPYSLQYQLDVQYAVGRIHFDTPEEYASYAHSVVAAEHHNPRPRTVAMVGVANPADLPTQLSATRLVQPLADRLREWQAATAETSRWSIDLSIGEQASRARVAERIGGASTPAVLFTASHGVAFPNGDPRQARAQGALVCQDWPGPSGGRGELSPDYYFGADDVRDDAELLGLLAFHFACFGAGTPGIDDFPQLAGGGLREQLGQAIAPQAFVAQLPKRLLGHPRGGALAVVGHVERALSSSFLWSAGGRQQASMTSFEATLRRLMRGQPVGLAIEPFNQRYAELCTELSQAVRRVHEEGRRANHAELAKLWMASTDARGYVLLGDPAVRLVGVGERAPATGAASRVTLRSSGAERTAHEAQPSVRIEKEVTTSMPPPSNASVRIDIEPATGHVTLTTQGGVVTSSRPSGDAEDVAFGWFGSGEADDGSPRTSLAAGLRGLTDQLTAALSRLVSDVSALSVSTYTSEDLGSVSFDPDTRTFNGPASLSAFTSIRVDGETVSMVPQSGGTVNDRLWAIHVDMVKRAQAHRAEFISAAASAASNILSAVQGR